MLRDAVPYCDPFSVEIGVEHGTTIKCTENGKLPSGKDCYIAMEHGHLNIVRFTITSMVKLHSSVNLSEGMANDFRIDLSIQSISWLFKVETCLGKL